MSCAAHSKSVHSTWAHKFSPNVISPGSQFSLSRMRASSTCNSCAVCSWNLELKSIPRFVFAQLSRWSVITSVVRAGVSRIAPKISWYFFSSVFLPAFFGGRFKSSWCCSFILSRVPSVKKSNQALSYHHHRHTSIQTNSTKLPGLYSCFLFPPKHSYPTHSEHHPDFRKLLQQTYALVDANLLCQKRQYRHYYHLENRWGNDHGNIILRRDGSSAAAVAAWRFAVASFSPAAKTALSGEGVVRECVLIQYVLNIRSMNVRRWKLWRLVGVYESSHFCRVVVIATVFGNSTGVLNFCYQHVRVNIFNVAENSGCLNHHFYLEVAYLATIFRTMRIVSKNTHAHRQNRSRCRIEPHW